MVDICMDSTFVFHIVRQIVRDKSKLIPWMVLMNDILALDDSQYDSL